MSEPKDGTLADETSEQWRYTQVSKIDWLKQPKIKAVVEPAENFVSQFGVRPNLLFVDGHLVATQEVEVSSKTETDADIFGDELLAGAGWNNLRAQYLVGGPIVLELTDDLIKNLGGKLSILRVSSGVGAASSSVSVQVPPNSTVAIVEIFEGGGEQFSLPTTKISVSDGANCDYVAVQAAGIGTTHLGQIVGEVARDAQLSVCVVSLGAKFARHEIACHTNGSGSSIKLNGVYVGTGHQTHDFRTIQSHHVPNTQSDLLFKGVVDDDAHAVYSGLISIDKGAKKTRAFQTNRSLILAPTAHADSVPNLEINENDVSCSHASAVGPIDSDQLFYLESRAVPTDLAQELLVTGFVNQVLETISDKDLRSALSDQVNERLSKSGASSDV